MSGAADAGELSVAWTMLLLPPVAVPLLLATWYGTSGATASGRVLLGATVVTLGAISVALTRIAVQVESHGDRDDTVERSEEGTRDAGGDAGARPSGR